MAGLIRRGGAGLAPARITIRGPGPGRRRVPVSPPLTVSVTTVTGRHYGGARGAAGPRRALAGGPPRARRPALLPAGQLRLLAAAERAGMAAPPASVSPAS